MSQITPVNKMSQITPASVLTTSTWAMIITGAITIIACFVITAPYGRYSTSKGWGPLVHAKLAWFLMESPNLWMSAIMFTIFKDENQLQNLPNIILLSCFLLHYINRSIIYPLRMRAANPMPVSVMGLAFLYCSWNGFTQSLALVVVEKYPSNWIYEPRFVIGLTMFFAGMFINIHADTILLNLRGNADTKEYKIPHGGMFEYVSAANYFGEIVEWVGFAIACWSLPAAAFAFYTFSNVGPRAHSHHLWYKQKFDNYPINRKAVIPFVW